MKGAEKLFWYNQLMVSTCRDKAKVGTISSSSQHYGDWKDAYPYTAEHITQQTLSNKLDNLQAKLEIELPEHALLEDTTPQTELLQAAEAPALYEVNAQNITEPSDHDVTAQQRLLAGMFNKTSFLDILQNFVLFETDDGKMIKKVARYQQYRAVNKVIERLRTGKDRKEKSGVVWHTQGSGKSLTMVMLAVKMRRDPILKQYKLVFITDRTQLDEQLSEYLP